MSKLLINENPLMVLPSLAVALGNVNLAIILQQVHYWIHDRRAPERDGHRWHYGNYSHWKEQFPWLDERTIRRLFGILEDKGILISNEYNRHKGDRTKWYTIDYQALEDLELSPNTHLDKMSRPSGQNAQTIWTKCPDVNKEEETTKETTKDTAAATRPEELECWRKMEDWGFTVAQITNLIRRHTLVKIKAAVTCTEQCATENPKAFLRTWLANRCGVSLDAYDEIRQIEQKLNKLEQDLIKSDNHFLGAI